MNAADDFFKSRGKEKRFEPNQQLQFNQKDLFFTYIESGEIDLFFLEKQHGHTLHHFRTVKEGDIIPSLPLNAAILVVGTPSVPTVIRTLHAQDALASRQLKPYLEQQIQQWVKGFTGLVGEVPPLPEASENISPYLETFHNSPYSRSNRILPKQT